MSSTHENVVGEKSIREAGLNVQELFGKIKQCVAAGDIATAEALRETLLGADTMALKEIVASAELIEEAKLAGIDADHLQTWDALYKTMSGEEQGTFFYSLVEKILPAKTVLTRQGKLSRSLFFIEQGQLAAVFTKEKKNHLVLQLEKGSIYGADTFFGMSVCTSTLVAQSEVVVKILTKERCARWSENTPGLYAKVESYCTKNDHYQEAFETIRQEKSSFKRISTHGLVCAEILNAAMKQTGKHFKASIADISRGGACFFIKAPRREIAGALLAKPLQMVFSIDEQEKPVEFTAIGRVVKIQFHMENDYSIHVQFASPLGKDKIEQLQPV